MCSTSRFSSSSLTGRVPGLPYDPFYESSNYIASYLPSFFTDGRASRKDLFCALERDDIVVLPLLLMDYTIGTAACRKALLTNGSQLLVVSREVLRRTPERICQGT